MNELINKQEKRELLYNNIIKMKYGDTILHNEIENMIEEKYNTNRYRTIIQQVKKKLIAASKCLRSIRGQGYVIIEPDQYTDMSLGYIKSGFKRVDTGYKILEHAPVNEMSKEGLQNHRHITDRAMSLRAAIAGGVTELKLLNKKSKLVITK